MSPNRQDALWRRDAVELAHLIRTRQVSSRDVIDAHLERIEAVNPKLNAIVLTLAAEARAAADAADQALARGDELGPLHGVPVTTKVTGAAKCSRAEENHQACHAKRDIAKEAQINERGGGDEFPHDKRHETDGRNDQ